VSDLQPPEAERKSPGAKVLAWLDRIGDCLPLAVRAAFNLFVLLVIVPGPLEALLADFRADLDQPLPPRARAHYKFIRGHLREPFEGYTQGQVMNARFQVITLSHMACGLMNVAEADSSLKGEVVPLLRELVSRATSKHVSAYGLHPDRVAQLSDHGLYLTHLNLILGCYRRAGGGEEFDALHERISKHLVALSVRDGDFHARSWPESPKWPADQAALLCSLYLYDQVHGTRFSEKPIRGWLDYMQDRATDRDTGLHRSSISDLSYAALPRGCALSWSVLYMAQFAPDEAARQYDVYRDKFRCEVLGCGGFREWPPGEDRDSDADSGPVVFGAGSAATGIGAGPARLFRDYAVYDGIMRSASTIGLPSVVGLERRYRLSPMLGEAILLHGETARFWFHPPPPTSYPRSRAFPTGPLLVLLVLLAICGLSVRRMVKHIRKMRRRFDEPQAGGQEQVEKGGEPQAGAAG
jgi:hypothetical protein